MNAKTNDDSSESNIMCGVMVPCDGGLHRHPCEMPRGHDFCCYASGCRKEPESKAVSNEELHRVPPKPLFLKGEDEPVAYFCQDCKNVINAEHHCPYCGPYRCACGKVIEQRKSYKFRCNSCETDHNNEIYKQQKERLMNAELTEPTKMVLCDCCEKFFEWDGFEYAHEYEGLPERVWACEEVAIGMDAESIAESACENMHEEAWDQISQSDLDSLRSNLDEWCEKVGVTSWFPTDKAILVKPGNQ